MGEIAEVFENKKYLLKDILLNIKNFSWRDSLYFISDDIEAIVSTKIFWQEDMECFILSEDDEDKYNLDDKGNIYSEKELNYKFILSMADIQDIMDNLKEQCLNPNVKLLIKAIKHYYENDGYLVLS